MSNIETFHLEPIDWRWMIVTYCFLVLFHFLPLQLIMDPLPVFYSMRGATLVDPFLYGLGIIIVSAYVGMKSTRITILEPAIASVFYIFTESIRRVEFSALPDRARDLVSLGMWLALILLIAFLLGCGGAAFGEWLQLRKSKNLAL